MELQLESLNQLRSLIDTDETIRILNVKKPIFEDRIQKGLIDYYRSSRKRYFDPEYINSILNDTEKYNKLFGKRTQFGKAPEKIEMHFTPEEHAFLEEIISNPQSSNSKKKSAEFFLMLENKSLSRREICEMTDYSRVTALNKINDYKLFGLENAVLIHRSNDKKLNRKKKYHSNYDVIEKIKTMLLEDPPEGYTKWSIDQISKRLNLSISTINKILKEEHLGIVYLKRQAEQQKAEA